MAYCHGCRKRNLVKYQYGKDDSWYKQMEIHEYNIQKGLKDA